jgi:hypothetical protein
MRKSDDLDPALAAALDALAEDERLHGASSNVEMRLRHAAREIRATRRQRRALGTLGAATAAAVLVMGAYVWRGSIGRSANEDLPPAGPAATPVTAIPGPFVPLPYSIVPTSAAHVVRMVVPRTLIGSLGMAAFDWPDAAIPGNVVADVMIGDDGLARAVRFVKPVPDEVRKP